MIDNTWPKYIWPDGKLKWIEGKNRKWDCEHVSKCDVLIDSANGMYGWNTDYDEPDLPYKYIFMDELLQFLDTKIRTRPPLEYCNCQPINI